MRIGLAYNLKPIGAEGDTFEEFDSEETILALESALRGHGHQPLRLGWGMEMLERLQTHPVDAVFNIAEGVGGRGRESQVPAVLEMLGIPCSGSDALAIALTLDKALAKLVAKSAGIATAPWTLVTRPPAPPCDLRFPLFVKPANEGSSMGITDRSLCHSDNELAASIERLAKYGPILVEEFLPGDEFTVGIIDGEVLGVMQVLPRDGSPNFIYSLDVKREYLDRVDYRLVEASDVTAVALQVWKAFGLRDVARVDVRRDRDGVANFVEVNPLPGVHPVNSDLVILARLGGVTHPELIGRITNAALQRSKPAPSERPVRATSSRPASRIAVAYNDDAHRKVHLSETEKIGEMEVVDTAREIADVINADLVSVSDDIFGALFALRPYDVVINLCEGVLGRPDWEMNFALALEMLGIAHTSCEPIATGICTDKKLVKRILLASGIPTPRFWHGEDGGRWIVKPSHEDAGIGIEAASVCSSSAEIEARAAEVEKTYGQPALVEEFIDGREFNQSLFVGIPGITVLPPGQILFDDTLAAHERVVGASAKWAEGSREDLATRNVTPALISDSLQRKIAAVCLRAVSVLAPGGYLRFDLRESASGELWIVDINPNPDLGRGSGFRKALHAAGVPFADFLQALIMTPAASHRP